MQIRVDLIPGDRVCDVVILVDALASCTAAPLLFDRGLDTLFITPSPRLARNMAEAESTVLLGARGDTPIEGFNRSSSPAQLAKLDFTGQSAVMMSDNAPPAVEHFRAAPHLLLGSLYNASALARAAAGLARDGVQIVACGFDGQPDLDDTLAAGYIAAEISALLPEARLTGAARLTRSLMRAFPDPVEAFWHSAAGRYLRANERSDDIGVAARISESGSVPLRAVPLPGQAEGVYRFINAAP